MTLHEAASVFLIIGGVLLGPIEGQISKGLDHAVLQEKCGSAEHWGRCVQNIERTWPRETTAETCARAMREIGAWKILEFSLKHPFPGTSGTEQIPEWALKDNPWLGKHHKKLQEEWWSLPPGKMRDERGSVNGIVYHKQWRVRCIPAPSGLVR